MAADPRQPRNVLVTGASGALGKAIVADLARRGRAVHAAARHEIAGLPAGAVPHRIGEISGETDWSEAIMGLEAVVHCAALTHLPEVGDDEAATAFRRANTDGTINLARQAAAAGARRFVFISSATVNGRSSRSGPFRPSDPPHPPTAYSVSKLEAEQGLRALEALTGIEVAIIRPPRIVWPEMKGNLALLERLVRRGVPLPFGLVGRNRRDNVSPESLVSLVRACLDQPEAAGRTFLVSDGDPLSTRELVVRLARRIGRKPRLLPVPPALLRLLIAATPARLLGKLSRDEMADELLGDLELDISETRRTLGWEPAEPVLR